MSWAAGWKGRNRRWIRTSSSSRSSHCRPRNGDGARRGVVGRTPDPAASEPGFRHPVVIIHPNAFNRSRIRTVVAVLLTSNLRLPEAPGNVLIAAADSGSSDRGRRRPRPSIS
ncbi:MAG: type II toxin-antitoxin system PemK/MazF family toxin [Candidatus Deferrimicrobiaceae bacterium]